MFSSLFFSIGHTDSDDSEFSSLEREKYNKGRRPTPHRRKSKPRHPVDDSAIYASPIPSGAKPSTFGGIGRKQNQTGKHKRLLIVSLKTVLLI